MSDRGQSQMFFIDSPAVSMLACPEEIWEKVFSFIQRPADRSSISQVCTQFYSCEARTREKVLISSCYAIDPEVVAKRFPSATAFSIKGKPRIVDFSVIPDANKWGAYATPWVTFFAQHYPFLSQLKLKRMSISNDDIQILVQGCGESLQVLEFEKCSGFSTIGLQSIAAACRNLRILSFSESEVQQERSDANWLSTLADTAKSLKVLDMPLVEMEDVDMRVLLNLASRCHTLRICESLQIDQIVHFLKACTSTVCSLGIGLHSHNMDTRERMAAAIKGCKGLTEISGLWDLDEDSAMILMPIAPCLTRLDLTYASLGAAQLSALISSCVNLDDLKVTDVIGDVGLSAVARSCKMMRTLEVLHNDAGFITQHGLIGVGTGLHLLEKLIFYSADMNSQALQILAHNCPRLTDIRLCHVQKYHASHPVIELEGNTTLNEGIKALVQGCTQLRRLGLCFCSKFGLSNVVVTEEGIRHIGKYGTNLSIITLTNCGSGNGESLSYIANGCLRLRKLELLHCNFNDASMMALAQGCPLLKYLWVQDCPVSLTGVKALARRPGLHVEFIRETKMRGMTIPWQLIAYASATTPRDDRPNHIDYVDESFMVPMISKQMPHRHNIRLPPPKPDGNLPDCEDSFTDAET
ncbi:unnamed protein product [Sphagnum troendelagicum]|uniref:F-box domain-containing protein n=1 Tax=Sphagnum troendelagicum TaxID=128251 RepID=A0ABP0U1F3_9BRYO